ncbi:MAG: hypothetical protein QM709_10205 [Spongiibacteraceae bacterium]
MVKNLLFLLSIAVSAASCHAEEKCTEGSEFEPPLCPSAYTKVAEVKIIKNAEKLAADKSSDINCDGFVLTEPLVRKYFELAKTTNENDAHHALDWSPCISKGQIIFADGKSGVWEINQFRVGSLTVSDKKKVVLFCPQCVFPPFQ